MKYLLRFIANSIALYLGLYLLDSLVSPRFWIKAWWAGVVLAVLLAALNSLIRPLHRARTRLQRALVVAFATFVMNLLVLQVFIWIRSPLSSTSIAWVAVAAAFVTVLAGIINWLVGFKTKEKPGPITRELRERQAERAERAPRRPARESKPRS